MYGEPSHREIESVGFMKKLADNIILGSDRNDKTLEQLDVLETQAGGSELLEKYRDDDETLLHLATKFHEDAIVVDRLVSICPKLLTMARSGKYEGQTALHIAVSKENYDAVATMVTHPRKLHLLSIPATGSRFMHTVMMGELPLSVAAMTFNHDIALELIDGGAKMAAQNSYGDTVFHSLVKYSPLRADKQDEVINMMTTLNDKLAKRQCEKIENIQNFLYEETDPVAVWLYPNYDHLTPLQLAAKLGQIKIFNYILNLEGVYCRLDRHDGLFDINLYDITEIDGVAMQKWFSKKRKKKNLTKIAPQEMNPDSPVKDVNKEQTRFNRSADPTNIRSVLERICKINVQQAFAFLLLPVIKSIIKDKWSQYRWYYWMWAIFHLIYMSLLTSYAIQRTKLVNLQLSHKNQTSSEISQYTTGLVEGMTYLNFVIPTLYLLFEIKRLMQKHYWYLSKIHHNGTYRLLLIIFSLTSLADAMWYKIDPGYNYCLIVSVLIGWWFMTFFLRAYKKFSFFTVMIQKVIVSDIIRFSSIIILELISFTAMIYILFLNSDPPVEDFKNFSTSMLTLFNLMLGLSDIGLLNQAQEPWLAVGLFILFALLTYVLMVNALIAMMSETCALVSSNKHTQWQLQRLSVILFIENTVFPGMKKCCGKAKFVKHFDIKQKNMTQEERYFLELDSLQTSYSKGATILSRRSMAQTVKFDDVHAPKFTYRQQYQNTALKQTQQNNDSPQKQSPYQQQLNYTSLQQNENPYQQLQGTGLQQNESYDRQQLQSTVSFQQQSYRQQLENTGLKQTHQQLQNTSLQDISRYQQLQGISLQQNENPYQQLQGTSLQQNENPYQQLQATGLQQNESYDRQQLQSTMYLQEQLYRQQLENTGLKQTIHNQQTGDNGLQQTQSPGKEQLKPIYENTEEPRVLQDSNTPLISDRQLSDRNLSDRQLSDRKLSDRQLSDRKLSDRQLSDRKLSGRQLSEENQHNIKPSKHIKFDETQSTSELIKDEKVLVTSSVQTVEPIKDALLASSVQTMEPGTHALLASSTQTVKPRTDALLASSVQTMEPRTDLPVSRSDSLHDSDVKYIQGASGSSKPVHKHKYRKRYVVVDDDESVSSWRVTSADLFDNQHSPKLSRLGKTTLKERQRGLSGLYHKEVQITEPVVKPEISTIYIQSADG